MTVESPIPFPTRVQAWPVDASRMPSMAVLLQQSIKTVALFANIEPQLICAVCEQESGWNPWAMRFEPEFLQQYVAPDVGNDTERIARATSWGLMQVMGQTAREFGFADAYLSALCLPSTGLQWGARVLARKLARAGGNVEMALLLWNGGGNKEYPAQVLARMGKYA
jgi:soluble lytic murein transglycosylase-like protein